MRKNDPAQPKVCTKHGGDPLPPEAFGKTRYGTLTSWCRKCVAAKSLEIWHKYKPTKISTRISGELNTDHKG